MNGEILDQQNLNIKCTFDHPGHSKCVDHQKAYNENYVPVKQVLSSLNPNTPAAPNGPKQQLGRHRIMERCGRDRTGCSKLVRPVCWRCC